MDDQLLFSDQQGFDFEVVALDLIDRLCFDFLMRGVNERVVGQ